ASPPERSCGSSRVGDRSSTTLCLPASIERSWWRSDMGLATALLVNQLTRKTGIRFAVSTGCFQRAAPEDDAFNLIQAHLVAASVAELRWSRALMGGDVLGVLQGATVL